MMPVTFWLQLKEAYAQVLVVGAFARLVPGSVTDAHVLLQLGLYFLVTGFRYSANIGMSPKVSIQEFNQNLFHPMLAQKRPLEIVLFSCLQSSFNACVHFPLQPLSSTSRWTFDPEFAR